MMAVAGRVLRLFVQPTRLFKELVEKPDVLPPFLILLGTMILQLYRIMPHLAILFQDRLKTSGLFITDSFPQVVWWLFMVVLIAGMALVSLLSLFVSALILKGLCRAFGMIISLPLCASLYAYCQLPLALRNFVYGVFTFATHPTLPSWHVGACLPEEYGILRVAFQTFDLFTLWSYVLLGLGLAVSSNRKPWRAWAVLILFVVMNGLLNILSTNLHTVFPMGQLR